MKYNFKILIKSVLLAGAALVVTTSCSDDDENTDFPEGVYFTGAQAPVVVADAAIQSVPGGVENAAFKVTFNASGNWQISATDFYDSSKHVDWVSFKTPTGSAGREIVGLYLKSNPEDNDRLATITIAAAGKTSSFTLLQQGNKAVANPNAAAINSDKTVKSIEYIAAGAAQPETTITFGYDANGLLASENVSTRGTDTKTTTVSAESLRAAGKSVAMSKLMLMNNGVARTSSVYAVANGKAVIGYNLPEVSVDPAAAIYAYSYNGASYLESISGLASVNMAWTGGNLTGLNDGQNTLTASYSTTPNDAVIDLNWYVGLDAVTANMGRNRVLGAMNLLGVRSANLVAAAGSETFTYTDGVTSADGEQLEGLTVTTSTGRTIKIYF